jgi:hypothetical protein
MSFAAKLLKKTFIPPLHSFFVAAVLVERKDAEHNRIMNSKI